ncbi:dihydromethanopterin reductase (acceptor) [Methanolobus psychrotolerans]|uniref:dihydromethanopterin reductase (acceptor) n=1 Tax=Methanolobus psychrotolerans TaxID=1874706 RepID=UPI000B9195D7|nr:dihydromethanopterin reductase (acceptor) [Methanolobus psychrotolerans]
MTKTIAWGITGAGHFLTSSFTVFRKIKSEYDILVNTFLSSAAEEVVRMYGLEKELKTISCGEYLEEIFLETQQGKSWPKTGRFLLDKYDALVVTPATSNTVSKIAYGTADSLVSNAVAQAVKGGVPVYVIPVDIAGVIISELPFGIARELCQKCDPCPPRENCPNNAITDQVDLLKCNGCGICKELCNFKAIKGGPVELKVRDIDTRNVNLIRELEGITVLEKPEDIPGILQDI